MRSIRAVDPFKCRVWKLHNRREETINEHTCKAEIEAFIEHGQFVPALGRPVHEDSQCEIELIYGARRLFVARHLKRPLLVEVREICDRDAFVALHVENRLREDISPYERGLGYAQWLRTGVFKSQSEIAQTLNVSAAQVSRLLRLTRLPAVVVAAFRSCDEISESGGLDLMNALEDPARRAAILRIARALGCSSPRLSGRDVHRRLLATVERGRKPRTETHDRVVLGTGGAPLFRIRQQRKAVALILPVESIPRSRLDCIEATLVAILRQAAALPAPRRDRVSRIAPAAAPPAA